jgi:hypothetical protein
MTLDEAIQHAEEQGVDGNACAADHRQLAEWLRELKQFKLGVPMLIWCPMCKGRHIDVGEFATKIHHTHSCQSCGLTWRPAIIPTVGVQFLPGYKN